MSGDSGTMRVAVAQVAGIEPEESRDGVVQRLVGLLEQAAAQGADLVVFPELTLTTFFPRYFHEDLSATDAYYETAMPHDGIRPLFDAAARLGTAFTLGYAELTPDGHRYNTSIAVDRQGEIVGKYRKVHVPGHVEIRSDAIFQHLEKRYFEPGNLGWGVFDVDGIRLGVGLCNDRRWPETYRMWSLQNAEIGVFGFNTPTASAAGPEEPHLPMHHHLLTMQAGAYQNSMWIAAAAKSGIEDGQPLMAGSVIISPAGEIVARSSTLGDEVVTATIDRGLGEDYRRIIFNFDLNRRPETYGLITERTGRGEPLRIPYELW